MTRLLEGTLVFACRLLFAAIFLFQAVLYFIALIFWMPLSVIGAFIKGWREIRIMPGRRS